MTCIHSNRGFPGASAVKNPLAKQETQVQSLGQEDLWRGKWHPTPVFLPGKSYGQRIMTGYSPWGSKESDMTERLTHTNISIQF